MRSQCRCSYKCSCTPYVFMTRDGDVFVRHLKNDAEARRVRWRERPGVLVLIYKNRNGLAIPVV